MKRLTKDEIRAKVERALRPRKETSPVRGVNKHTLRCPRCKGVWFKRRYRDQVWYQVCQGCRYELAIG